MSVTRRKFVKCAGCVLAAGGVQTVLPHVSDLKKARYYTQEDGTQIQCQLCPRGCLVNNQERGFCGVRENKNGIYYTLVYGKVSTAHIDPVEKKPLFHVLPGDSAFSIATVGCNVMCKFCQNWELSQTTPEKLKMLDLPPQRVASLAQQKGCSMIAYTYNEPVIFTEYMYDTAKAAKQRNVRSVMISNGYINKKPMRDLCRVLDAVKIDLKAFNQTFYHDLVAGELQPVLDTLVLLKKENIWTEIVYLVIPGQNDDSGELKEMCEWIKQDLGPDTPLHFSRFYPQFKLKNLPPTPIPTLKKAREIAMQTGLHYVYIGNIPGDPAENTYCPQCGKLIIRRTGYYVRDVKIKDSKCSHCGAFIAGIWN